MLFSTTLSGIPAGFVIGGTSSLRWALHLPMGARLPPWWVSGCGGFDGVSRGPAGTLVRRTAVRPPFPTSGRKPMFERFTDRARRVVVLAQEEARLLNHNYIGTEHILLGLIHEGEGVAA